MSGEKPDIERDQRPCSWGWSSSYVMCGCGTMLPRTTWDAYYRLSI